MRKIKEYGACIECNVPLKRANRKFCSNKCQGSKKRRETFEKIEAGDTTLHEESYREYLINKYGSVCMECNWSKINIHTGKVPIQLEHIDGNFENNTLSNLKILCPNCHSLTPHGEALTKAEVEKKDNKKERKNEQLNDLAEEHSSINITSLCNQQPKHEVSYLRRRLRDHGL